MEELKKNIEVTCHDKTDWYSRLQNHGLVELLSKLGSFSKDCKVQPAQKAWFSHDLRSIRDRWKEESDPATKKSIRNSYVKEFRRVKASFFSDKAAKLSKSEGGSIKF